MNVKVWQMNDYDWFTAETLAEAERLYLEHYGADAEEMREGCPPPIEMTEERLKSLAFVPEQPGGRVVTFWQQLQDEVAAGTYTAGFFASTNW